MNSSGYPYIHFSHISECMEFLFILILVKFQMAPFPLTMKPSFFTMVLKHPSLRPNSVQVDRLSENLRWSVRLAYLSYTHLQVLKDMISRFLTTFNCGRYEKEF